MLDIGHKAPSFKLKDHNGDDFNLFEALGKDAIVLYFYPKNETPGCTKEACAFRDLHDEFRGLNAKIVGVSQDSVSSHQAFRTNRKLPFTLLSDPEGQIAKLYDVGSGLLGLVPGRVTYVIDKEGIIKSAFSSQLNIGRHVRDALAVVRQF